MGADLCYHLKWHSAFEILLFCSVCSSAASFPSHLELCKGGGHSISAMECVAGCSLGRWVGLVSWHPSMELPLATVIGNRETESILRALDFTAIVTCGQFLQLGKIPGIHARKEENVLITVCNSASPFLQSNIPSLVFYLSGFLALSLPLLLALSSAEVLCPGNRTGNDVIGWGPTRPPSSSACLLSSQMFCARLLA